MQEFYDRYFQHGNETIYVEKQARNSEWEKYKEFLINKLPEYAGKLNTPAAWWEINLLEQELGIELPEDFKNVYAINNGEIPSYNYGKWGILCGSKMLSLEEIHAYFEWGREFENWVPIFKDPEEDCYIGIEVSPVPHENQGQVSLLSFRDTSHRQPISPSLSSFFKQINHYIDRGFLYYSAAREINNEISVHDIRAYFEHYTMGLIEILQGKTW